MAMSVRSEFVEGRKAGYPACCSIWFAAVFAPFLRLAFWLRGTPEQPATGLREVALMQAWRLFHWWTGGRRHRTGCTPCPWHRAFGRTWPTNVVSDDPHANPDPDLVA
jgi:hypothetical protein